MAARRMMLPDYGTVSMKGTQYYRTRVTDQQGRRVSLYVRTREELYQKEQEAIQQIENKTYRRSTPTVEEYCEKWLLMQSAQIRMTTLIDYTSKVKNLALLAVVYQNFSLQCFAKEAVKLPAPDLTGGMPLMQAMKEHKKDT